MRFNNFTGEQTFGLSFMAICGNLAYNFIWVVFLCGRSSWVAIIIGIFLVIPFVLWILHLSKDYPGYTIFDIIQTTFGKYITWILIIMYCILTLIMAVSAMNMFTGEIKIYFLPITPTWIIMLFIMLISLLLVNSGSTTMGRVIEILAVWCVINYFSGFFLSLFKEFNFDNITPVFDTTVPQFAKGVLFTLGGCSEMLLFQLVMVGVLPEPLKYFKWFLKGIFLWVLLLSIASFLMIGIKSSELLIGISQVGIEVATNIQIGNFIRGLEVFILITYQTFIIAKTAICIYSILIPVNKLFNNNSNKISKLLLILIALLIYIPSLWLNSFNAGYFLSVFLDYYLILPFIILVSFLCSIAVLVQRKRAESNET